MPDPTPAPTTPAPTTPTTPPPTSQQSDTLLGGPASTTPPAPATPPTSEASWRDSLPDDLKSNEKLAGFKTVAELAKAHAESKFAAEVPTPDKYQIPQGMPKGIGEWANKNGMTQAQLNEVFKLGQHMSNANRQALDKSNEAGLNQLFTEWGPEKDTNVTLAKSVVRHFDKDGEMAAFLKETRAGNHPLVVKFFARMGQALLKEDVFLPNGELKSGSPKKSDAEIIFDGK